MSGDGSDPAPFDGTAVSVAAWWISCAAFVWCAVWSVRLSWIDLRFHRLPNREALPSRSAGACRSPRRRCSGQGDRALSGLVCGIMVCLPILVLWLIGRSMGLTIVGAGDVKLAVLVGFVPGWCWRPRCMRARSRCFLPWWRLGFERVIALARRGRRAEFAFGPAMLAAMWFAAFVWPWCDARFGDALGSSPAEARAHQIRFSIIDNRC